MKNNMKGYTLMEVVVVMFAMTIITTAVAPFIRLNVNSYLNVTKSKFGIQTARIAFNKMLSELRMYANGTIDVLARDHIRFRDEQNNIIDYRYDSDSKGIGVTDEQWTLFGGTPDYDPFIGGVETLLIQYFDQDGNYTGSVGDIKRIRIIMVIADPEYPDRKMYLEGQVCLNRYF